MITEQSGTMRAIVLAGVHQWDDSAIDAVIPRPLLPVVHAPIASYVLNWLRESGIKRASMCANSASRHVRRCFGGGERLGIELDYFEDWTPRGPGGCVRDAGLVGESREFVIVEGTMVPRVNLAAMVRYHRQTKAMMTVAANMVEGDLRPAGVSLVSREVLEHIATTGYQDIKEILIPKLHQRGERVFAYVLDEVSPRVCGFDSYLTTNAWVLNRVIGAMGEPDGFERMGDALVHYTAAVSPTAGVIGQAIIGPRSRVGANAVLVGPTVVGADCDIEMGATVSRSVLWDHCQVERGALVDQSIIGYGACVGAGVEMNGAYEPSRMRHGAPRPGNVGNAIAGPRRRTEPRRVSETGHHRPLRPAQPERV